MPGRNRGDFRDVGKAVAPPHDVQVGTQQQQVVSVDVARDLVRDLKHADRRLVLAQRCGERRGVGAVPVQPAGS